MTSLIGHTVGRYHIVEQLGQGGMAVVYKGYDNRLERYVAVKVIRFTNALDEHFLKRFDREAKALAQLQHPNIVGVIDYGEYEGSPYLVMEYIPGGTLKNYLGRVMPFAEAAALLSPIARALEYAHQNAIVHRDVKPANILLTASNQPMLTDFGIARLLNSEESVEQLTGTGVGVGTPEYMAPEQWLGQAGPSADIYALGVVFYELITGRRPYSADTPAAVLLKAVNDPLPRPRDFVPSLPEHVEQVIYKALAKKPEDRYDSMDLFARALDRLASQPVSQESQPIPAQPPSPSSDYTHDAITDGAYPEKAHREAANASVGLPAPLHRRIHPAIFVGGLALLILIAASFVLLRVVPRWLTPGGGLPTAVADVAVTASTLEAASLATPTLLASETEEPAATATSAPPTATPTASPTPGPVLLEEKFNSAETAGGYDLAKWYDGTQKSAQIQKDGEALRILLNGEGGAGIGSKAGWPASEVGSVEVDLRVLDYQQGTSVYDVIRLTTPASQTDTYWTAACEIQSWPTSGGLLYSCGVYPLNAKNDLPAEYVTRFIPVEAGKWYHARMALNPETSELKFYLDGVLIGQHAFQNAETIRQDRFEIFLEIGMGDQKPGTPSCEMDNVIVRGK
jgi:tRNA A-37 threonylcarbamoyl transferase component Bud32